MVRLSGFPLPIRGRVTGFRPRLRHPTPPAREAGAGGDDALRVRRTLPSRRRSFVGAWCFADHYGPETGVCMDVTPDSTICASATPPTRRPG